MKVFLHNKEEKEKEEMLKQQEIRADFDSKTITVYQAYNKKIALPAIKNNRFEAPFSFTRMTWIKPSYLWLMERSNWGTKSNQEYILGIKIKRDCWEKALAMGVLTDPDKTVYKSGLEWEEKFKQAKVHIQWDPERSLKGGKLQNRTIQVGISRFLIEEYNNDWIEEIVDVTPLTKKINQLLKEGKYKEAKRLIPKERVYNLPALIAKNIAIR
ncbi:DUF4291 domain-containing protein [Tenacibaculum sp. M341]|uniref:DUF4291 domain-containing protein n=1 Tax=Tenacibaculum sp. M341 TaxID=2530339 RepID=UPI001A9F39AA|nr:DUF4291 domain-containing protein [Tenacibaculum sp. M341]